MLTIPKPGRQRQVNSEDPGPGDRACLASSWTGRDWLRERKVRQQMTNSTQGCSLVLNITCTTHTWRHACMHMHTNANMNACVHVHMYTHRCYTQRHIKTHRTHIYADIYCTHTQTRIILSHTYKYTLNTHTYTNMHLTHKHTNTYTVCTYIHIQTHCTST